MLCEKCKKNEAKINLVKIVNGEKQQIWLCEECAKNISSIPFLSSIPDGVGFPFQEILNGLLTGVENTNIKDEKEKIKPVCPTCGLTYDEFKKTKKAGCPDCYSVFKDQIKAIIKNVHGEKIHQGRIPSKAHKEFFQRDKLKNLKQQLQILIEEEEYEKAAIIRDEIREIELYIIKSNTDFDKQKCEEENCNGQLDS